jgi:hypothetical protein
VAGAAILLLAGASQAGAAACRDAKGQFTACPAPAAKVAAERCRSAAGTFVTCKAASAMTAAAPAAATVPAPRIMRAPTGSAVNTTAIAPAPPVAGAVTARCRDGSLSHSLHRSGSCSGHGGVAAWM